jgi:putative transposase
MVGVNAGTNVCSWIVSEKMSHTISTESRTAEKAFVIISEYDDRILEIWDQPQPIKIEKINKNGDRRGGAYTADFVINTKDGPRVIEVKPFPVLEKLIVEYPENWIKDDRDEFHYLPAEKAYLDLGLVHKVFAYKTEHQFLVANLELMMRSRSMENHDPSTSLRVSMAFEESFSWSLYDLKERLSLPSYESIIQLIDQRKIFCDIKDELLSEPMSCFVAPSEDLLIEAKKLRDINKIFSGGDATAVPIERFPPRQYAQDILDKLEKLEAEYSGRSARRWRQEIVLGRNKGLSPFQSLISKKYLSGNRKTKIHAQVKRFLEAYLLEEFAPSQGLSIYRGYVQYKESAIKEHPNYDPVSRKTFTRFLKKIPPEVIARKRSGKRGANAVAAPSDPKLRSLKAQLPWQIVAIDHYKADIFLIYYSNQGDVYVERPWITAMIDLCTGSVLAITLSFKDPSKASCAKVIRECVRNHSRLPAEIIVDRGSEFKTVYLSALLAHYGVTLSLRPAAHSRYGGEVEGLFGEFKKQWLCQRPGNLADYREARSVDGKLAPKNSAILKPYDLYRELKAFLAWRDAKPKGVHAESGADRFERMQTDYPFVAIDVEYGDEFMLATSVESKDYTVDFQRGIHINELFYYTPNIQKIRGKKTKLEVRRDPENPHVIYAFIDNHWECCYSSSINSFSSLDPIQQFEKGLVAIEAANFRRKIAEECDVELVRIIREMDALSEGDVTPIVHIPDSRESVVEDSVIDQLDFNNLRKLSVGEW